MKNRSDGPVTGHSPQGNAAKNKTALRHDQVSQAVFDQAQSGGAQAAKREPAGEGDARTDSETKSFNANDSTRAGSVVDEAARTAADASAALLESALATPAENALPGRPLSLADALGRVTNPNQRLEVASLYWKLALALADYHWALDESQQLGALPGNEDAVDAPLLAAAQAAAQATMLEAKAATVTAQQELADAIGQPTQPLPLSVEQPLVGAYRTEFDTIFAGRAAPGRSRAIHRALPHWREAIDLRAAAVQAAASAIPAAEAVFGKQKTGVATALYAHHGLSRQRRAFLNAVREYNAEIVEYVSYVAGPTTSTATLVSMLTRSKPAKNTGIAPAGTFAGANEPTLAPLDTNVRPASAEETADDDQWRAAEPSAEQR